MHSRDTESRTPVDPWLGMIVDRAATFDDLADAEGEGLLDEALLSSIWKLATRVAPQPEVDLRDNVRRANQLAARLKNEILRRQSQIRMHAPLQTISGRQCVYLVMMLHRAQVEQRPLPTEDFLGHAHIDVPSPGTPDESKKESFEWIDKVLAYSPLNSSVIEARQGVI